MKKVIFVTGTRADYGKIKSLIIELKKKNNFKIYIFVTGMHNLKVFGTVDGNTLNITENIKSETLEVSELAKFNGSIIANDLTIDKFAKISDTIPYRIITSTSQRFKKTYI